MSKPQLLDLFCGAGGASMGYYRAGFEGPARC
jgi:DNA (cytosine-5)-methyltransferase 1